VIREVSEMKLIKRAALLFMTLLLLSGMAACSGGLKADEVKAYADPAAENILKSLEEGSYERFSKDFNSTMKQKINEQAFRDLASLLKTKVGSYISSEYMKAQMDKGNTVVYYKAKYAGEPDDVLVTVVFSTVDGKRLVSGLWFNSPKLAK
jgi:hypothetical protein